MVCLIQDSCMTLTVSLLSDCPCIGGLITYTEREGSVPHWHGRVSHNLGAKLLPYPRADLTEGVDGAAVDGSLRAVCLQHVTIRPSLGG